ncbi:GyrI-like domain-containing protein [Flavobacterium sp. RHBU_24]|uniref:GyrI-like domain-containing protein n=1 Tax=Flavobacterium sp. RHBU_24 TaxID=3391185 RepID=UPI003984867D
MLPEIRHIEPIQIIGLRQNISYANNTTHELWKSFMPRLKEVPNKIAHHRISLQNYPEGFFRDFNPYAFFEKWAGVEVTCFDAIPDGMETFTIPAGKYAVFHYKGNANNAPEVFRYILAEWLPQSGYTLDDRPHFEILGEKYKNGEDDSEEDIYIPIVESFKVESL